MFCFCHCVWNWFIAWPAAHWENIENNATTIGATFDPYLSCLKLD